MMKVPKADVADRDENYVGQMRAFELAHRLNAKGLARIVKTPKVLGEDWNDVLARQLLRIGSEA